MDSIIKHYFNKYRDLAQLPPIIEGKVTGWLAVGMPKTLKHEMSNGITVWGRPDDYLKLKDSSIVAFDHKTKSKEPEDVHRSYQLQLDVYSYLLKAMGYETTNKAYLAFYYPDECELHEGMPFNCTVIEVKTDQSRVEKLTEKAYTILHGKLPNSNENCNYCKWHEVIF